MEHELTEAVESIIARIDQNKYYSSLGYFQGYSTVDADSSGKRFCQVKLHTKDRNANDISIEDVPLGYPGSKRASFQDDLELGDDLMLFFTDRTLEQWKDSGSVAPQITSNTIRNQRSNAFAIPLSTHHNIDDLNLPANDNAKIPLASGKKIQIGLLDPIPANKKELLDILYQVIEIVQQPDDGGFTLAAKTSSKGKILAQLQLDLSTIADIT